MTEREIRQWYANAAIKDAAINTDQSTAFMVMEIAAQLAQANTYLERIALALEEAYK